jgi:diaminobutyrate-2-oxoglutarate transaminase
MRGLDLRDPEFAAVVRQTCVENGLIIECCGPQDEVLKVLPPLTTPDALLEEGLGILTEALLDAANVGFADSA